MNADYKAYPPLTSRDLGEIAARLKERLSDEDWRAVAVPLLFEIGRRQATLYRTRAPLGADDAARRAADPELDALCSEIEYLLSGWSTPPRPPLNLQP